MENPEVVIAFIVSEDGACPRTNIQTNVSGGATSWEVQTQDFERTKVQLKYAETPDFNVSSVDWMNASIQFMQENGVVVTESKDIIVADRAAVEIIGTPRAGGRGYLVALPVPNRTLVQVMSFDDQELERIIETMSVWNKLVSS